MNKPTLPFFYGWVVAASCFICCFSYGLFYTMGIFFTTLQAEFGWSSALTSSIHSLHLIIFIPSTFFMGWLADKYGPRLPIVLGAIFIGVGFSLLSQVKGLSQFYLFYVIASLGAGIIFSLPTSTVQKWFVKRSGLALGIVLSGIGAGTLFYAPLAEHLISIYGWRTAYIQIGAGTAILLLIASIGATTPEKKGIQPYGSKSLTQQELDRGEVSEPSWGLGEALRNKSLWLICALYTCTVLPIHIIAVHLVPFAESTGIDKGIASWALGLVGGISILGRIITPTFVEGTIGWRKGIIIITAISAASFIWVSSSTSLWAIIVFVVVYGFCYGSKVPLVPALMRFYFGTKSLGQIVGFIHAVSLVGGAIGPLLAGYIVDVTGNYTIAFLTGAIFWVLAAFFAWLSKAPKR
jgi:OFA family oxalate/formate antiporter-like MFS transporter